MNRWSENFLKKCKETWLVLTDSKFRLGYEEHDGDLRELSLEDLLKETKLENIDQFIYFERIEEKVRELVKENKELRKELNKKSNR